MAGALRRLAQRLPVKELFSKPSALSQISIRTITHKDALEIDPETPPPWPYKTKKYRWYHSVLNLDKTIWRINENSKLILVEGNIGAGKTTFAKNLAEELGMKYFPEPDFSEYYEKVIGFDIREVHDELPMTTQHFGIEDFYKDPNNWHTAEMQVMKYIARWLKYVEALNVIFQTGQGVVMERSPYSDFIFVDAMVEKKYMGRNARRFYYDFKSYNINELMRPHCVIYLDAPIDVCMERIKKRNIDYEVKSEVLTPEYLQLIEDGYKKHFLPQMEPFCEVLVYDWTKIADAERVAEDLEKIDFDKERVYFDPKFRDWRELTLDSDWDEQRVKYRDAFEWHGLYDTYISDFDALHGAPELLMPAEDNIAYNKIKDRVLNEQKNPWWPSPDKMPSWNSFKLFFS